MPDAPQDFAEHFAFLRENGAIPPEYPTALVPQEVKEMIAGLSQAEMDRLRDICLQTQSYLYLNLHGRPGIVCGF
jgi:hypothetical protein